jgi:heptosyltransferase I
VNPGLGDVRSLCIVLLTGLGDVVMGMPVANALKRALPGVRITWVAEPMPAAVLRPHPAVDEVVVYEKKRGLAGVRDLRRALAGRRFDLTLNLNVYFKSIWPTLFSAAPRRLGFGRDRARDGVWLVANEHLPARPRAHTLDMFLEFPEFLGIEDRRVEWRIPITEEERRVQAAFFEPLGDRPVVAVVPATAMEKKDWLAARWAEVVDTLELEMGYRVVLVGGPGERETRTAREIVAATRSDPVWGLGDGVRRLVWMLEGSQLVIAPDTGPVHIARALDVPVIGLYGHTNPWRVGPYRKFQDLWVDAYTDPGEAPDPARFDPKLGRMETITARDVLDRVERARTTYDLAPRGSAEEAAQPRQSMEPE